MVLNKRAGLNPMCMQGGFLAFSLVLVHLQVQILSQSKFRPRSIYLQNNLELHKFYISRKKPPYIHDYVFGSTRLFLFGSSSYSTHVARKGHRQNLSDLKGRSR